MGVIRIETAAGGRTFWDAVKEKTGIDSKAGQTQVNQLSQQVAAKANSAQPAWQNIPLLGAASADSAFPVQYYKDTLGVVHLRGSISADHLSNAAQLPAGFIPGQSLRFVADDGLTSTLTKVYVTVDGYIQLGASSGSGNTRAFLDGISFRAEF
ncbi:MAG: hypothetical protein LPK19_07435 [Hymenobacteraceae bacterium]|nr:hypothetical protein [Hymenobacteraceae bacterium]MDX5396043.1 hypothetical protein [Hymenobacteraceae bacterium]MDX5512104.1 hypothetical protein [Hymenobacteraceae bacterium]